MSPPPSASRPVSATDKNDRRRPPVCDSSPALDLAAPGPPHNLQPNRLRRPRTGRLSSQRAAVWTLRPTLSATVPGRASRRPAWASAAQEADTRVRVEHVRAARRARHGAKRGRVPRQAERAHESRGRAPRRVRASQRVSAGPSEQREEPEDVCRTVWLPARGRLVGDVKPTANATLSSRTTTVFERSAAKRDCDRLFRPRREKVRGSGIGQFVYVFLARKVVQASSTGSVSGPSQALAD